MDTQKFYDFDKASYKKFSDPIIVEKNLQTLLGIILGIQSDQIISDKEYDKVTSWINSNKEFEYKQPYKEIIDIIRLSLADKILTQEEVENITWYCNQYISKTKYFDVITHGIQKLVGIVKGITIDDKINIKELEYLDRWIDENEYLKNTYPYDEIYNLVTRIIQDHAITFEEHDTLLNFCKAITGNNLSETNSELVNSLKTGFYQIDPTINIQENTFCITGISKKYKRQEIAEKIEMYGGYMMNKVSAKLNYLVVCDEKNSCWAFTCYGRKIEEAIKHRKKGANLIIVHEFDLYDTLENL